MSQKFQANYGQGQQSKGKLERDQQKLRQTTNAAKKPRQTKTKVNNCQGKFSYNQQ
jgi:hypothetical protein